MRRAWVAMMLLAAGAFSRPARAEEARFAWHGPACAESAPLLERRLADLLEPQERARLAGRVAVTGSAARYDVELSIDLDGRPLGTRRFEASDCARAAETAAVAASLAVYDGEGEPEGVAESGLSPDIWTRRPEPVPDFSRARPATPAPPAPFFEARVGVLGLGEVGALPEPAAGGALLLELGIGKRWAVALLASASAPQRRELPEPQSVRLSWLSATSRVCGAPLFRERYRLDGCVGAQLVQMRGHGEGFDQNRSASLLWTAPLLGVNFSVLAPSFLEWRGEVEGAVPLSRRRFLVDDREVARASAVVGTARLGALVRFR